MAKHKLAKPTEAELAILRVLWERGPSTVREVTEARIFDLTHQWDENSPIASVNPPYNMSLKDTHSSTRGIFGDGGQLSFAAEIQDWSGQHGAPSIDAIGHIGRDGKLFGGVDAIQATANTLGIGRSGVGAHLDIAHYPKKLLVNRGVLLDVARFVNGDLSPLPQDFEITAQHLEQTAKAHGVKLERGDTILIRTGWGKYFQSNPALYKGDVSPGLGVDGAKFLVRAGAKVVGNDTLTFEKRPPIASPPLVPTGFSDTAGWLVGVVASEYKVAIVLAPDSVYRLAGP